MRFNTAVKGVRDTSVAIFSSNIKWAAGFSLWAAAVSANIIKDSAVVLSSGAAKFCNSAVTFSWAPFSAWRAAVWVLLGVLAVVFKIRAAVGVFFFQAAAVVIKNWFHCVGYTADGFLSGHPWDVGKSFITAVLTFTAVSGVSFS